MPRTSSRLHDGSTDHDRLAKTRANPACPLGPDYRQVGAEHVFIGASPALRAKAQRARKVWPGLDMGGGDDALISPEREKIDLHETRSRRERPGLNERDFARSFTSQFAATAGWIDTDVGVGKKG